MNIHQFPSAPGKKPQSREFSLRKVIHAISGAAMSVLVSTSPASAQECGLEVEGVSVSHRNDISLTNGDTNDSGLTGSIQARIDAAFCDTPITIEGNLGIWTSGGVDGAEDTQRVDTLEAYLGTKKQIGNIIGFDVHAEYGAGISAVGNFGGEAFQKGIHSLTGNSQETANYTGKGYGITPFLRGSVEATKTVYIDNPLSSSAFLSGEIGGQLSLLQKFGATEAYAEVQAGVNLPYGVTPYVGYHLGLKDFPDNPVINRRINPINIEDYAIAGVKWDIQNFDEKPTGWNIKGEGQFGDIKGEKGNDSFTITFGKQF